MLVGDRSISSVTPTDAALQRCLNADCDAEFGVEESHFECPRCGDLLDVCYDWTRTPLPRRLSDFEAKWSERTDPLCFSGVWRFRDLLPFARSEDVVTIG